MSFIYSLVARAEVAFPRSFSFLNLLSLILLGIALVLPVTTSLVVLIMSMLIQAAFFRVMHRQKVGTFKLLKRLAFLLISSATFFIVLFQHHLL
ncbi:MAG: hypothetical protein JNK18_10680 [Cyclobacteriaceae bacterium]|nr:hypothetical protein [Cyclobacteriaceae bacterium]